MSFLSDIFHGNFSNLGNDLFGSPTAIAETLGAVALPFAAFAAPEILGASLLPTAGEGVLGAAAGEAAPASLGAAFGGASAGGGLLAEDTGTTALAAFPESTGTGAATDAFAGIEPGMPFSQASTALGDVGVGQAPVSAIPANAAAPVTGMGQPAWPGFTDPTALSYTDVPGSLGDYSYTDAVTELQSAGGAGGPPIDVTGTIGPSGPIPNAPQTLVAPAAAAPEAPGGVMGALKTAGGFIKDVAPIAGVAGLGLNLYRGYEDKQQLAKLSQMEATAAGDARLQGQYARDMAKPLVASGEDLMHYINTGTLPAPFQAQLKQIVAANKARIIQGYATRGMPTDPTRNSALAQDLANADQQAQSLKADMEAKLAQAGDQMVSTANQLLAQGLNATQIGAQIPIYMQRLTMEINNETAKALASFAGAMNSGQGTGRALAA